MQLLVPLDRLYRAAASVRSIIMRQRFRLPLNFSIYFLRRPILSVKERTGRTRPYRNGFFTRLFYARDERHGMNVTFLIVLRFGNFSGLTARIRVSLGRIKLVYAGLHGKYYVRIRVGHFASFLRNRGTYRFGTDTGHWADNSFHWSAVLGNTCFGRFFNYVLR